MRGELPPLLGVVMPLLAEVSINVAQPISLFATVSSDPLSSFHFRGFARPGASCADYFPAALRRPSFLFQVLLCD